MAELFADAFENTDGGSDDFRPDPVAG